MHDEDVEKVHNWIKRLFSDPIVKILIQNCHLSKIQLETILIDLLAENIIEKELNYENKAKLRQKNQKISRGAFNRTLKQSNTNIMKSINTIILLGYLGILKSPKVLPLIEISNKMDLFIKKYRNLLKNKNKSNNTDEILLLKRDIENSLKDISF